MTHTQGGTMAMEQVQKSREYGADMERLVLSHVQKNPDPWYHPWLLETGITLCYEGSVRIE